MDILWFAVGLATGVSLGLLIAGSRKAASERELREAFSAAAYSALKSSTDHLSALAGDRIKAQSELTSEQLEGKKRLIDQSIQQVTTELLRIQETVHRFERDREQKFGELSNELRRAISETARLQQTTEHLQAALANTRARGQWGERMAEDVLRLAGFIENVNYCKQRSLEGRGARPDFTFFLPQGLKVNMDVKFPLDNYQAFLATDSPSEQEHSKQQFLKDVRGRIKEVSSREYINPADKTVDYVLVFIPNETIYGFIHEHDPALLDDALRSKVVLCSPLTLYAVLAIIRQAVDNFNLERRAAEILRVLSTFHKEWEKFVECMDKVGRRLDDAKREFDTLVTTRRRRLDRAVNEVDSLQRLQVLASEGEADDDAEPLGTLPALEAPEDEDASRAEVAAADDPEAEDVPAEDLDDDPESDEADDETGDDDDEEPAAEELAADEDETPGPGASA